MDALVHALVLIRGGVVVRVRPHRLLLSQAGIFRFPGFLLALMLRLQRGLLRDCELHVWILVVGRGRGLGLLLKKRALGPCLISGGDEPRSEAGDAIRVVTDTDEERTKHNREIEAIPRLPFQDIGWRWDDGGVLVRDLQRLVVQERAQEERSCLVVIELRVREVGGSHRARQEFGDLHFIRRCQEQMSWAIHSDELLFKLTYMGHQQLLLWGVAPVSRRAITLRSKPSAPDDLLGR
mmetsp:Transcript_32730/g.84873  ORF Transcript_32730/g.84873 Transcript_32730/m.84873 type:complete len:237 (-) Transcript_32730:113-823(-)